MFTKKSLVSACALASLALWSFGNVGGVSAADTEAQPLFEIRQLRVENGQREVVRFNVKTGESWSNWTSSPPEWTKITETGPVPVGDYDVLLLNGPDKDTTWGIRFDKKSGKTWNFGGSGWAEFKEVTN